MNEELERKLVAAYPSLYRDYGGDPRETCMAWGIACGDGWFKLINDLSAELELMSAVAAQVKEKFGCLRFYLKSCPDIYADAAYELIEAAEELSCTVCEMCGEPGEWFDNLAACQECREKRRTKAKEDL